MLLLVEGEEREEVSPELSSVAEEEAVAQREQAEQQGTPFSDRKFALTCELVRSQNRLWTCGLPNLGIYRHRPVSTQSR